jgi:hypothetical protein
MEMAFLSAGSPVRAEPHRGFTARMVGWSHRVTSPSMIDARMEGVRTRAGASLRCKLESQSEVKPDWRHSFRVSHDSLTSHHVVHKPAPAHDSKREVPSEIPTTSCAVYKVMN